MRDHPLAFQLPLPWAGQLFRIEQIGSINFLVGPNGSGKSRFANLLLTTLGGPPARARLLGTDRLSGMEQNWAFTPLVGDPFSEGYAKHYFKYYKQAGAEGSGIDTIVLLEERLDLRIRIEATLSHLFDREITLDWDSGNLVPKVTRRAGGPSYRLDRDECHGIKELLVLLTHLYDSETQYLIIDEPELNLHPQYQAFFMQEIRSVVGRCTDAPSTKIVFLVTHSPFILDLKSEDDINSIISFDLEYTIPKQVASLGLDISPLHVRMLRMNAHHKQLFFADNPILVEGIHDASLVEAMMEARNVSLASAGSCLIDAGGVEESNQYLKLCQGLGKTAHFLYDLDSLFRGTLRRSVGQDESLQTFLAAAGLGNDFKKYCGQLDKKLTGLIDQLLETSLPSDIAPLQTFFRGLGERDSWTHDEWSKARTATMTAISRHRTGIASVVSPHILEDIEGRLSQILIALREKNIHVLPGGTLERYLPSYRGDEYEITADAKRSAVRAEIAEMVSLSTDDALAQRYGDLYKAVCHLPSKRSVNIDAILRNYLSSYIHELQRVLVNHPDWSIEQIQQRLNMQQPAAKKVFAVSELERRLNGAFRATILVAEMLGETKRIVRVNENTNAGMGEFIIESHSAANEASS